MRGAGANPVVAVNSTYDPESTVILHHGDRLELLYTIPSGEAKLVVTSPPYNIGKRYERRTALENYLADQERTIAECVRILSDSGSICWQVGNHITADGEVVPLDIVLYPLFKRHGLTLRNRLVWTFDHGLHCSRRFSGRHETILWFAKSRDYIFNLDEIRIPQKYPGKKYHKGPKAGQYSANPLGKNPGDVWVIPNVKHNHIEKTVHPCQFPIELIERLVLSMTNRGDLVVDPYIGVGSSACAAVIHGRRAAGSDTDRDYIKIGRDRVEEALTGCLHRRPMDRPVYEPDPRSSVARRPETWRRPKAGPRA
jgi:adenine-specific DNA-methyltransferase